MTRSINAATETASSASTIIPVWFVKLEFASAPVCLHTLLGTITWGGDTYTGAGDLGSISPTDEDSELSRSTLKLGLRGIPNDIISILFSEHYQGRTATLYLGYLDETTRTLVDTPIVIYRGRMDEPGTEQGETLTVSLSVESRFAAWDRPNIRRYNHADQQERYEGDLGLQYVEQTTEKNIVWGQKYAG